MSVPEDGAELLAQHLQRTGGAPSGSELDALLAGIAAAPETFAGPDWIELVAPDADERARAALVARRSALAAATHGLGLSPAPAARLDALRAELARRGLDGFLVPRADEHQGEYVPLHAQRLAWLTGFTGSAGLAIALRDSAAIFVDGRYTLQVTLEVDTSRFAPQPIAAMAPDRWLAERLRPGQRLGFDPWLHSVAEARRFGAACQRAGAELVPVDGNPVDAVWPDQPPPPISPVRPHPAEMAGQASEAKRQALADGLRQRGAGAAILTLPDSIAWLLNIRGADVPHVPLPLGFAVLHADENVDLFIDRRKLTEAALRHLGNRVSLHQPEMLGMVLDRLGGSGGAVMLDPSTAPHWIASRLQAAGARLIEDSDPTLLPKACKNEVEIAGTRAAHRRDGAALCRFLAWLDREAPGGTVTEIQAAEKLQAFRRADPACRDLSFDTIAGSGPNGAIVHYRVTEKTDRKLGAGELFLLDSGAQYPDGTTDVTRTVAIGAPTAEMRDRFTRVLKGHIALATARFPAGTSGSQLDALARRPLWEVGLDYDHGTGHGVGSYLSVHEGPQRISKMPNSVPLLPGMIVSNEPGYYKTGAYGIRIENLVLVRPAAGLEPGPAPYHEFETLTLAPIDRTLVDAALLTSEERGWLDAYHARVRQEIGPLVDEQTRAWLEEATRPLD